MALHESFQALPPVLDLVTSFLLPRTIDCAVYNRLDRLVSLYGDSCAYTVGAMDGAAAKGHLDLVQWLHTHRTEGCSSVAFIKASVNNHLQLLEWLYQFYPQVANPTEEIVKAAECGNTEIIMFLHSKIRRDQVEPALEAAAANGHVEVLNALLNRPYSMRKSFVAAAANGQTQVVQFLLERGFNDRFSFVNPALVKAAEGGHCEVISLLFHKSDAYTIGDSLIAAAADGREAVVTLLLESCKIEKMTIARALEKAAENCHYDALKLLLENFNNDGGSNEKWRAQVASIDLAFTSAVERGCLEIVKLLIDTISTPLSDVLIVAGANYRLDVLGYIIDYCETRNAKCEFYYQTIADLAEMAATSRNIDMAKILVAQCVILNTGGALRIAVDNDDVEMLRVFLTISSFVYIRGALVKAVKTNRVEMLEILIERATPCMIEEALMQVGATGTSSIPKMLLDRCDPGSYCRIFDNAAGQGLIGLIQLLQDKMERHSIRCAVISAAIRGHADVVKELMDKCDLTGITCAFEMAALRGYVDIVNLLRGRCEADSIGFAISAGDADIVRSLRSKRARLE
ncbi:hypothetical protein PHMEG_00018673 [Phytophthora megakarya]|uniref:Uncharacterized protein n=1 Tax=Phytophthora megakarya TaxID=4795 RepID=A0A225VVB2_9STRA|nr:hypothetical protein PHMEG_00018673 [Phytophthora megakarya]